MFEQARAHYSAVLDEIRGAGLFKRERVITSPQGATISTQGREVLNFCANNYLGLSSHPAVIDGARRALETHGFGMSSVRFICGTQDLHKELEATISRYFGTDDTILYSSCFDANGGLFETLLGEEDAILTNIIHQDWSGVGVTAHKNLKGLKTQNLRDHMSEAELIFTALAELSTRQIAESVKATGMVENKSAARTGGRIAKGARLELESKTGRKVITGENYLPPAKAAKQVK